MRGKIVSWLPLRGFGFIKVEGRADDVFFHISDLKSLDIINLDVGVAVEFELGSTPKGPRATKIVIVN